MNTNNKDNKINTSNTENLGHKALPKYEKGRFKMSGHSVDQSLKSGGRKKRKSKKPSRQLSLFEDLGEDAKNKIIKAGYSMEWANAKGEGINLTKGEYRLILALCGMLHSQSANTSNPQKKGYYSGIPPEESTGINTTKSALKLKSPRLSFTFYEIAKAYNGGGNVGGKDLKEVAKMILSLSENSDKKCLMRYSRITDIGKGETQEDYIQTFDSLIKVMDVGFIKRNVDGTVIDQNSEVIINLHPVFVDQIDTKYVYFPVDIVSRMLDAHENKNFSEVSSKLLFYLAREHSSKRFSPEIGEEKLLNIVAGNYMRRRQKKQAKKYLQTALNALKSIGLLIGYKVAPAAKGAPKFVFSLRRGAW